MCWSNVCAFDWKLFAHDNKFGGIARQASPVRHSSEFASLLFDLLQKVSIIVVIFTFMSSKE
jgi:hypothetical protein